ncbi:MAG TPA: beta-propeller fold lactonase family protein, partial [Burkholderiales bacterium]|nr:beta-propeller fold lactonase family protein [Burkholderiales bacterium]
MSLPSRFLRSTALAFALLGAGATFAAPFAYVPNEKSGTLSVIDTATDQVVGEIKAGAKPRGTAVSRDGKRMYVSDQPANSLDIIDVEKRQMIGKLDLGESPEGVSLSPDGKWVVAAVEISNSIAFVDTATGKKEFSVKVEGKNPEHAVFSPDGKLLF